MLKQKSPRRSNLQKMGLTAARCPSSSFLESPCPWQHTSDSPTVQHFYCRKEKVTVSTSPTTLNVGEMSTRPNRTGLVQLEPHLLLSKGRRPPDSKAHTAQTHLSIQDHRKLQSSPPHLKRGTPWHSREIVLKVLHTAG